MSWLSLSGLNRFLSKLRSNVKIAESRYTYTTEASGAVSFAVPDFTPATMTLDVYINGLHCIPTVDYTLEGNVMTLVNELDEGQTMEFVVRQVTI